MTQDQPDAIDTRLKRALDFVRPRVLRFFRETGEKDPRKFADLSGLAAAFQLAMVDRALADTRPGVRHPNKEQHWRALSQVLARCYIRGQIWGLETGEGPA